MSERVSGTVTFVYTDIEGSTELLKRLGREKYGELLERQKTLLREAFDAGAGDEVDNQGDQFFVAFRSARDALLAAATIQRSLADLEWPDGVEVSVRIGVHSGEAAAAAERYVGIAVHRAARIGAIAHGGQVLISDSTRALVEEDLPEGLFLRDLGLWKLKDIDRPERVSQLAAEGLRVDFPPLRGAERVHAQPLRRRSVLAAALVGVIAAAVAIPMFALSGVGSGGSAAEASIGANSIGAMDASSGRKLGSTPLGATPGTIAAGDGSVWVTDPASNILFRIDPRTNSREQTIGIGNSPGGVAVGGNFVWAANGLSGDVSKIDPNDNGGSEVDRIPVGNGPSGVAFGGGHLWVANSTDRTVGEIAPGSGKSLRSIPVPQGADAIVVGFGFVWVVSGAGNSVTRIDARTGTVLPPLSVGNDPTGIAVGAGAVWVANRLDGTVSKIDPAAGSVEVIPVGGTPTAIAAGQGVVWVSDARAGTLTRIDPTTGKTAESVKTGNPPGGLTLAGHRLYVAVGTSAVAHRGGTLTVFPYGPFDSIDPAASYSPDSWSALSVTNDGLVTFERVGGSDGTRIVPDLATSLPTIGDGGRAYTFQLRAGVRYSTGGIVQPSDFRRAIERSLEYQSLKNPLGAGFYYLGIVGAPACLKATERCDLRKGIVTDPTARTVTFRLTAPDPDFLDKLALSGAYAAPAGTGLKARLPLPATGPYMIASYDPRHGLTLVRNPRFREWSAAAQPAGFPDEIVYRFDAPNNTQISDIERGTADFSFVTTSVVAALQQGGFGSQLHFNPSFGTDVFSLNTTLPPFDNVDARRAINYAVDRTRLARLDNSGGTISADPTCQVLPPNLPGYARYCSYPHNLTRAKQLVTASGTIGQTVTVPASPSSVPQSAYLVSVLKSLGYKARLKKFKTRDEYRTAVLSGRRYQTAPIGWFADYPSSSQFFTPVFTCATAHQPLNVNFNLAGFCDRLIDREIDRATTLQINDPLAAAALWSKLDRDVMHHAPWVPVGNRWEVDFVSRRVGNYQYNPQWGALLDQMWLH
jgi:YVTN family beta-propeller protein